MFRISIFIASLLLILSSWQIARAGDYLNEQEVERVREAQEIDKRTAVFVHIAERRLNALLGAPAPVATTKDKKDKKEKKDKDKENNEYGPEPTGNTVELLESYSRVMAELLDKLDDSYDRKKSDPALPKAMEKLLSASQTHITRLEQMRTKIRSAAEETALEKAMEIAKMANDGARGFKMQ
jgi:hypothetical protein